MENYLRGLVLIGLVFGPGAFAANSNFKCAEDKCSGNQVCFQESGKDAVCLDGSLFKPGNCSTNVLNCDDMATCVENTKDPNAVSHTCVCVGDASGDGFEDGTGCQLPFKPCTSTNDCPQFAACVSNKCKCKTGFEGDSFSCKDKNECDDDPCKPEERCFNTEGSYYCKCDGSRNYIKVGDSCKQICTSHNDCDWPRARCNKESTCECIAGFAGDGKTCTDVDECALGLATDCHENARCVNTQGSYECRCNNGYSGDGKECAAVAMKCEDIPGRRHKKFYTIDPDGSGPARSFTVQCFWAGTNHWVTAIVPKGNFPLAAPEVDAPLQIQYKPSPDDIKAMIENFNYCSQTFSFVCAPGYAMFPGTSWTDIQGNVHNSWGSKKDNMCACGDINRCPNACYCDGSQTDPTTTDKATILDKTQLPLVSITFNKEQSDKGRVDVEPLMCSQKPFFVPKDCHEAKFRFKMTENGIRHIDVDGEGGQEPFLVFCDQETYEHVGITVVPTEQYNPIVITDGGETITYPSEVEQVKGLIEGSVFCSQRVEFKCKNSKIGPDGAAVHVTGETRKLDFFPGGNGKKDSCGCGATKSCDNDQVLCNCNIDDGEEHKDFGLLIDKSNLPVTRVTAQVGGQKSSTFEIGELRCSQKQFDIAPNCEKYYAEGVRDTYTYLIDPDGEGGLDPFPVQCVMEEYPPQGKTVVHHNDEGEVTSTDGTFPLIYLMVSPQQVDGLLTRSTFCTQQVSVGCQSASVPAGTILWTGSGDGPEGSQKLSDFLDTCGPSGDNCQCANSGDAVDKGTITDKGLLPINTLKGIPSGAGLTVGPLECSEIFPTCKQLYKLAESELAVEGERTVVSGIFTVDTDGPGGVPPMEVECQFPETIIQIEGNKGEVDIDPEKPETVSKCFDINYRTPSGISVTPAQAAALVAASKECEQTLSLTSVNAPATGMVNFTTCDGKSQQGWAGSYGKPSCACGVAGVCDGGRDALCNSDLMDGKEHTDAATIYAMDRQPVCQVCLTISPPADGSGWPQPIPVLKFEISKLVCDQKPNSFSSCQEGRRGERVRTKKEEKIKPMVGNPPVSIGCVLYRDPPLGVLTVKPKEPNFPPTPEEPVDVKINYITINMTIVGQSMSAQKFCSQKVFLYCANDSPNAGELGGDFAWYGRDGSKKTEWKQLPEDGEDVTRLCEENTGWCNQCGPPKAFLVEDKDVLPITRLVLNGKNVGVIIEDVECFDLMSSCQEIWDKRDEGARTVGYFGRNRYVLDPDKSGPIRPFRAYCEWDKTTDNAVTVVEVEGEWTSSHTVEFDEDKVDFTMPVEYTYAKPDQIHALAEISKFCWQGVQWQCKHNPLLKDPTNPTNYLQLYGNDKASSWGTGNDTDFEGCACHKLGFCSTAYKCNCDAEGPNSVDQGTVSDKDALPILGVHVNKNNHTDASAKVKVTDIRCSSQSVAIPKDCAEAYKMRRKDGISYVKSGEYLISPDPAGTTPYMVYCDFDQFPDQGVTVIRPNLPPNRPVDPKNPGDPTEVPYFGVEDDQIAALIARSAYCYQGVKYDCFAAAFLGGGAYFTNGKDSDKKWSFWGGGKPAEEGTGTCACGDDHACAGLDSAEGQRTRPCNCDLVDEVFRKDAGLINIKEALPIRFFTLGEVNPMSQVNLTVGDLICSQKPLKINECELGLHDCHSMAECRDQDDGYYCVCPKGYRGQGVVVSNEEARANGRECIDDNECEASNPCSYRAECHNLPGDFECTCKTGYKPISKTDCEDIKECDDPALNDCGENAHCIENVGSYKCSCNKGYRGDGRDCQPVGMCMCFGDPHCQSFDNKWLHFQGNCEYILATDGCDGSEPAFTVKAKFWRQDQDPLNFPYSWVESLTIITPKHEIKLEQGPKIVVDGTVVGQYIDGYMMRIVQVNKRVLMRTLSGLEVSWDGVDRVGLSVPQTAASKTCGLCGNYNGDPSDDWTIGPACPADAGQVTENYDKFGRSWACENCPAECDNTTPPSPPTCQHEEHQVVVDECTKLMNRDISPFKECLKVKTDDDLENMQFSCIFDLCSSSLALDAKICRLAETIYTECAEFEKIESKNWRKHVSACEEIVCPNNQVYMECQKAAPKSCLVLSEEEMSILESLPCVEGCFCEDGLLQEGDHCITQEQCGCFHEGTYIETDASIIKADCSGEIKCLGLNKTEETPVNCPESTECRTEDGITGCYCKEGYLLIDGVCKTDSCEGLVCGANMECVEGECVCLPGYNGDCGECVDVDECEDGTHTCVGVGQTCVNEPGSFKCECEPGFVREDDECRDVNECQLDTHNCGSNSECVNIIGGYLCECCAGFIKDLGNNCVPDPTSALTSERCCACQGAQCAETGKVCGTDGNTYESYRELAVTACVNNDEDLEVNYDGSCHVNCQSVICNKQYAECKELNPPQCRCPVCGYDSTDSTVCGTNGVTYSSVCSLKREACKDPNQVPVDVESEGPCPGDSKPVVGSWTPWSECSETCQQGFMTRTRQVNIGNARTEDKETTTCYNTCEEGPCTPGTCTNPSTVCVVNDYNLATCVCPSCNGYESDPVCARVGENIATYESDCHLKRAACKKNERDWEVLETRPCEEKPVDCSVIKKNIDFKDDEGCVSAVGVPVGNCYGGCTNEVTDCCQGVEFEEISATINCPDETSYEKKFLAVTKCGCVDKASEEQSGQQQQEREQWFGQIKSSEEASSSPDSDSDQGQTQEGQGQDQQTEQWFP